MLAAGLSLALFAYWTLLGSALVWPLESRMNSLRKLLLAPAIGIVINGIPLFVLNIYGVPVSKTAIPVGIVLFLAAVVSLWAGKRRERTLLDPDEPRTSLFRQYLPFAVVLLGALVLTGRPMFLFNFDWVSFCNDDMANYCLGAHRVLDNGYFHQPDPHELARGVDYVQQMWFLHVPGMHRPGSEMVLAFMCAWTRLTAPEVFMVVIMAMHLCQISAMAALMYQKPQDRTVALVSVVLLSLSALASLGALYQLIAQVSGLAITLAAAALLLRPMDTYSPDADVQSWKSYIKPGILLGVIIGGLIVFYPEVFPFLGLAWLMYTVAGVIKKRLPVRPIIMTLGVGSVVTVIVLNMYTSVSLTYLFKQASTGTRADNPQQTLFPYYLMPSGLSNLWNLQPLATLAMEPFQSAAIAVGAILFIGVGIAAVVRTWRGDANATFALLMFALGLYLFKNRAGFGLYKLAMYAQPFFLALVATVIVGYMQRRRANETGRPGEIVRRFARGAVLATPLIGLAGFSAVTQWLYVRSSCGVGQTFNEILDASDSRVYNEFRELVAENRKKEVPGEPPQQYLVDSYNLVLAKFQSIGNRGREMAFPSNKFYYPGGYYLYPTPRGPELVAKANELMIEYGEQFKRVAFFSHKFVMPKRQKDGHIDFEIGDGDFGGDGDATNTFVANNLAAEMGKNGQNGGNVVVVATTGKQSPFNRRHVKAGPKTNFIAYPANEISNHLVFVDSELGHPYFSGGRIRPNFAIYQLEAEPLFFRGNTMAGVGRYVLFQVINPSIDPATGKPRVRMVLDMTASYRSDSENFLPKDAIAIGVNTVRFPTLGGRGAARVVSEPFEPQYINGAPYVQIDLRAAGKRFPEVRQGLMKLFGNDVAIDRRALVGFLRDISLVSEEEYAAFKPPVELSVFGTTRNDLREYPDLEYSGIYEDGWVSEASAFKLRQLPGPSQAVVRGEVPMLPGGDPNFELQASLVVDGVLLDQRIVKPGRFELRGNAPATQGLAKTVSSDPPGKTGPTRVVELKFTKLQQLPPVNGRPDGRPVAARMFYIGFQPATGDYRTVQGAPSQLPLSGGLH